MVSHSTHYLWIPRYDIQHYLYIYINFFQAIITMTRTYWPKIHLSTGLYPLNWRLQKCIKRSFTFWDITLYSPLKVNWRFGETPLKAYLLLQGWRVNQTRNQDEADSKGLLAACFILVSCLAYSSTLKTEQHVPLKCQLTLNGLHSIALLKTEFIITAGENLRSYTSIKQTSTSLFQL
jgi:hypothetical protein